MTAQEQAILDRFTDGGYVPNIEDYESEGPILASLVEQGVVRQEPFRCYPPIFRLL